MMKNINKFKSFSLITALLWVVICFVSACTNEKDIPDRKTVDPIKQSHRISGAIAATRYPFLDETEETWPLCYQTVVNAGQKNFGLNGPEGAGFIYPSIVILDCDGNIREIAMVETESLITEERAGIWQFLSDCKDPEGSIAKLSIYIPRELKDKAGEIIKEKGISNYSLHGYHVTKGYLEVDGSLVHNVFLSSSDKEKYKADIPQDQKISSEAQRNRVIRINAATGYPYLDQGDNSWSPSFRVVVNDEQKRFGIKGPDDMGMIYPSIIILDEGDRLECFGIIEPAENVCEERARVWKFLSETLDNPASYKFLFIHVPRGLEEKAFDILERNNIQFAGLRGYSVVDHRLLITIRTFTGSSDNR